MENKENMVGNGDFIEIEYTGKISDNGIVFDTTNESVAKENGLYDKKLEYKPIIIRVGSGHVIKGLDEALVGVEIGKNYNITIPPEKAFGKKNIKYIQLISTSKFIKQKINPTPGLQVNIDGMIGTIKSVSGGRTLVDFNHPLAGKSVSYEFNVKRKITDDSEKLKSLIKLEMNIDTDVKVNEGKAIVKFPIKNKIPSEIVDKFVDYIKKMIPSLNEVKFETDEKLVNEKNNENIKKE